MKQCEDEEEVSEMWRIKCKILDLRRGGLGEDKMKCRYWLCAAILEE